MECFKREESLYEKNNMRPERWIYGRSTSAWGTREKRTKGCLRLPVFPSSTGSLTTKVLFNFDWIDGSYSRICLKIEVFLFIQILIFLSKSCPFKMKPKLGRIPDDRPRNIVEYLCICRRIANRIGEQTISRGKSLPCVFSYFPYRNLTHTVPFRFSSFFLFHPRVEEFDILIWIRKLA